MASNQSTPSKEQYVAVVCTGPLSWLHDSAPKKPVDQIDPRGSEFGMGEKLNSGKFSLQGQGEAFFDAFERTLGFQLPRSPNTSVTHEHVTALWQSPREWLIVLPEAVQAEIFSRLKQAFDGQHVMLVDVSDRWLQVSIVGQPTFAVLSQGTSIDLNSCLTAAGDCAQTLLALVPVIIHRPLDLPAFDIYVDRSFAEFLWCWLENAASAFEIQYLDFILEAER